MGVGIVVGVLLVLSFRWQGQTIRVGRVSVRIVIWISRLLGLR
jgi:hypothetical protein